MCPEVAFGVLTASVGEPVGADRDVHFGVVGALRQRHRVALEVEDRGSVGVPGRNDRVAPPVTTLVVVDIPGHAWVVGVAGVVVLRVDLDPVTVGVAQIEVEGVRDTVAARSAFDRVGEAQRTELVADGEDVVLLVRGEGDVVHAWSVATGHRRVMHGGLAAHPRRVDGAFVVLDVLGDAEAQVLHVVHGLRHVRGDLVEVVDAHERARGIEVVAPGQTFDVVDLVEEFVGEAEGILHAHRITDAGDESFLLPHNRAAELTVVGLGGVDVFGAAHAVGECGHRGNRTLAEDEVVVDELLHRPQVDGVFVFFGDLEVEHIDVEVTRLLQIGDDELHVGASQNVRCRN